MEITEGCAASLEEIAEYLLSDARPALILAHARPDGDTLGCAAALALTLRRMGREARAVCADAAKITPRLSFISDGVVTTLEELPEAFAPELFIALDTAEQALFGDYADRFAFDVKVDHHPSGSLYAKLNYINGKAASCGELVFRLISLMAEKCPEATPDKRTADALYAAIASDTGSFRYRGVGRSTHEAAGELIELGADHTGISERLFARRGRKELDALRVALDSLRFFMDGRVAAIVVTNEMKEKYSLADENMGELNSFSRDIDGVDIGITLKQQPDDPTRYKLSLRSSEAADVSVVCARFGGGGHLRAAGAMLEADSPDAALEAVLAAIKAAGQLGDGVK